MKSETIQHSVEAKVPDAQFLAWWIAAMISGHLVVPFTYTLINIIKPIGEDEWPKALLISLVVGVTLLGVAQGVVLSRSASNLSWFKWGGSTVSAYSLILVVITIWIWLEDISRSNISGQVRTIGPDHPEPGAMTKLGVILAMLVLLVCIQGFLVGIMQSWFLKLTQPHSIGWIRINMALTPLSAFFLSISLLSLGEYRGYEIFSMLFALIGGALAGIATGQTLIRYLDLTPTVQSTN